MAENGCTYRNPLVRDGVSQSQRLPEALDPDYVKVDERSLADLLRFAVRFAEEIQYYGPDNKTSGDWRDFFAGDITSVIALLTDEEASDYEACIDRIEETIFDDSTSYQETRKAFKTLFDLIGSLALKIDRWYTKVPEGYQFREHLYRSITSRLRPNLMEAIAYYKAARPDKMHLVNKDYKDEDGDYSTEITSDFEQFESAELKPVWIPDAAGEDEPNEWKKHYEDDIESNDIIYLTGNTTIKSRVRAGFPYVKRIAETFVNAIKKTQGKAPDFIEQTLTEYSAHDPQMGLMLTFFKLFRYAREHINTLTRRHLNFYYEDVLKLERKPAQPDRVHLLAELAKHVDEYMMEEGTLFKDGKDAGGNEVVYRAVRDVVLNKARVTALKSVYIDKDYQSQVYEKPIANSKDGLEKELEDPSAGWKAFGESQVVEQPDGSRYFREAAGEEATMQLSDIGFAISSPVLQLAEGRRTITLDIFCGEPSRLAEVDREIAVRCLATSTEKWVDLGKANVIKEPDDYDEPVLRLEIVAGEEKPPISSYDPEVHGGQFQTRWPVLKLILVNEAEQYAYEELKDLKVSDKIDITVDVEGVKNLVLQNEMGMLDPGKPFQPFGPKPARGSAFYIGSPEVFSKQLTHLTLNLRWHDWPAGMLEAHYNYNDSEMVEPVSGYTGENSSFKADLEILRKGSWERLSISDEDRKLFPVHFEKREDGGQRGEKSNSVTSDDDPDLQITPDPDLSSFQQFNVSLKRGFVKLVLSEPEHAFGHDLYPDLLTKQVMEENTTLPKKPYTPTLRSLSLDYTARDTVDEQAYNDREARFYTIYPFGEREMLGSLGQNFPLVPQFKQEAGETIRHKGEFYIGVTELDPPRQVSLLVKVAEGSAAPSLPKQPVSWFYLTREGWEMFDQQDILRDTTNGLLTTGILRFNVPGNATSESRLFPGDRYWIKAAVPDYTDAVCRLINVRAQAVTAEFVDRDNDPSFLSTTLPAGSVGKLKTSRSEVKKIQQPYASEGGKMPEQDTEFHRRISERLRHKQRGVTIWDYERLVLEHFPEVYKAKCVNHSTYNFDTNGRQLTAEFAPGYVSVVVIPDLRNKNAVEPLKPRLSQNVRDRIKKFLKIRISPFVAEKLKVMNPLFEQVKVSFDVKFRDEVDVGYHLDKLEEDIKRFLSPWAYLEGQDISFGGSIHASVILNFVEERDYVDYVTDFTMNHLVEEQNHKQDVSEITVTTARSVLVSHKLHDITSIE